MYKNDEKDIRNRENVKNNGEVFTPFSIVEQMLDLIPDSAWSDKEYIFLEPTCGNGQFLYKVFQKRIANGISIEDSLNTMLGMDITVENVLETHKRLFTLACEEMIKQGIKPKSNLWYNNAIKFITITRNNIFLVKDSLKVMADYGNNTGMLVKKKFVYNDPTGNLQVMTTTERNTKIEATKKALMAHVQKPTETLEPFFGVYNNG